MDLKFYYISDCKLVGKVEEYIPYVYNPQKQKWQVDDNHIIMDRLMGYDEFEPDGSPYKVGNTDILSKISGITKEKAEQMIQDMA